MKRFAFLPIALVALFAVGCGESGDGQSTSVAKPAPSAVAADSDQARLAADSGEAMTSAATGARIKVVDSDYGRVVADGKGEALYLFDKENAGKPECYGACAKVWPPLLTKGKPAALEGAKTALLGTVKRANGKLQVTYAGQPLYYYVDDSPGTILCHDVPEFGGTWLVIKPNGNAA